MERDRGPDPVAVEFARRVRERLGPRVRKVVLFGSRARGDGRDDSDYDVVVVVDRRSPDVREALLEIEVDILDRHGSLVACLLRDEREWTASQGFPIRPERRARGSRPLTPEVAGLLTHARAKLEAARVLLKQATTIAPGAWTQPRRSATYDFAAATRRSL